KDKEKVKYYLEDIDHMPVGLRTHSEEAVDYPDFAVQVSKKVDEGAYDRGSLICGSGQGVCMTANKFKNIRGALVYDKNSARMTRQHNNANILCLRGRQLSDQQLKEIVETWLNTDFEGGRHERRTNKIKDLTQE